MFGIVQSEPGFHEQHKVVDGCSDVLIEIFGKDVAYHARYVVVLSELSQLHTSSHLVCDSFVRSAIGTSNLPLDVPVEVEAIVEVSDEV